MAGLSTDAIITGLVTLFGGGGLGAWLSARAKGKVDLVTVAQNAAREVIETLQDQLDRQEKRVGQLEQQVSDLKKERHDLGGELMAERQRTKLAVAACEAAEALVRALQQQLDSLQRRLVAAGLPIDAPAWRNGEMVQLPDLSAGAAGSGTSSP